MPAIIAKSISILSDAGLGMAMFSLGKYRHRSSFFVLENTLIEKFVCLPINLLLLNGLLF